jgi:ribosome-binding factor A
LQSRRLDRLGGQIQEEVSDIILRKLRDPRIGFVTVTKVRVSADLSYASIYISVMGGAEDIDRSLESLEGASSFIRSEMGKRLKIRHIPEIRFHYDDTEIKGARIDSLLKRLKESRDDRDPQVDS